jgi:ABC-type bacteriocin/lantibiotic exporter with double-glycine peptidase domain
MSTYWGIPASENTLARDFLKEKLEASDYTTNFADMKRILEAKGFKVAAYKMNPSQLSKATERYAPLLVHYAKPEGHFVLVLSVREESVVVADPAQGLESLALKDFEALWSGYVLLAAIPKRKPNNVALDGARAEALGRNKLLERASLTQAGAARW